MYVPPQFALTDPELTAELMARHAFALLVTAGPEGLQATHLPLLHERDEDGGQGRLIGHLSRGNPQCRALERLASEGGQALAIFQGPHAYVSPRLYAPGPAVPTWNYLAVHAYGIPRLLLEDAEVEALLLRLVETFEAGAETPWDPLSQRPAFLAGQRRGVLAFSLPITRLEGKAKLNQNRPECDRRRVAAALAREPAAEAQATADWMRRLLDL